ncbi:hypothetical protein POQMFEI_00008 [Enterococcus phage vB_OCPT_CCS2]|nr:hypothetical protein POQMFEI_00008 [Enterococcus phage vB_OCPT_CCS2]
MDYSKFKLGDIVMYQGQLCGAGTVINGNTYTVVQLTTKPRHAFIIDEHGNKKLIQMGFNFAKIKEA